MDVQPGYPLEHNEISEPHPPYQHFVWYAQFPKCSMPGAGAHIEEHMREHHHANWIVKEAIQGRCIECWEEVTYGPGNPTTHRCPGPQMDTNQQRFATIGQWAYSGLKLAQTLVKSLYKFYTRICALEGEMDFSCVETTGIPFPRASVATPVDDNHQGHLAPERHDPFNWSFMQYPRTTPSDNN